MNESNQFLQNTLSFWDKLNQTEQTTLLSAVRSRHFAKGELIHSCSEDCIGIMLVKSGCIRAYLSADTEKEVTLYRLFTGEVSILSASCILEPVTFDIHMIAEDETDVIVIRSSFYQELIHHNIYVEAFTYRTLTEQFSDIMWSVHQILFLSFDKRLAAFLLDEAIKNESDEIRLTQEQIASYLSTAREVVSRMLNYFSKNHYITLSRGCITLTDKKALRAIL